ncbi:MAG: hypothetical protein BGN87_09380 [Rhizobiales bacterium 65-79]|nr:MAG: hypothetical protein BGN87_09380 [Rhizobiales bacterium 65-79]
MQAHYADILDFRRYFWLADSNGKFADQCFSIAIFNFSKDGYREFPDIASFILPLWEKLVHDSAKVWQRFKCGQRLLNFSKGQYQSSGMWKAQRSALKLHHCIPRSCPCIFTVFSNATISRRMPIVSVDTDEPS